MIGWCFFLKTNLYFHASLECMKLKVRLKELGTKFLAISIELKELLSIWLAELAQNRNRQSVAYTFVTNIKLLLLNRRTIQKILPNPKQIVNACLLNFFFFSNERLILAKLCADARFYHRPQSILATVWTHSFSSFFFLCYQYSHLK